MKEKILLGHYASGGGATVKDSPIHIHIHIGQDSIEIKTEEKEKIIKKIRKLLDMI